MSDLAEALETLLSSRFSCRSFSRKVVDRATIERILSLAQRTASWCNTQPWQTIIVSGSEKDRLRDVLHGAALNDIEARHDFDPPRVYEGVYRQRRKDAGLLLYGSVSVARGDHDAARRQALENFNFFGAPHVAIITTEYDLGAYGAIDCGAYVSNFMLSARAFGVDAIAQAALAKYPELLRAHFHLGQNRRVVCGISFGYADESHPANRYRTSRAGMSEAVTFIG